MGTHDNPVPSILSVIFAFFSLITMNDAIKALSIVSALAALVCACLGAYNHWLGIQEKKMNNAKLKAEIEAKFNNN